MLLETSALILPCNFAFEREGITVMIVGVEEVEKSDHVIS